MQAEQRNHGDWNLPAELPKPAQRALAAAGYTRLEQLTNVSEADLQQLHGVDPKALEQLRRAAAACGLSFARRTESMGTGIPIGRAATAPAGALICLGRWLHRVPT